MSYPNCHAAAGHKDSDRYKNFEVVQEFMNSDSHIELDTANMFQRVIFIMLAMVAGVCAQSPEFSSRKLNFIKVKVPCSPICKCTGGCDTPIARTLSPCAGKKQGFFTEKWRRMEQVEDENCGWADGASFSVCKIAWGKQQGGDEVLQLAFDSALACMGCAAGCAACAGAELAEGLAREILEQIVTIKASIISSLHAGGTEFANKLQANAQDFLFDMVERAMEAFLAGDFSGNFWNNCIPGSRGFELGVRAGVAYYGSENCVCGACVPALNAMRPWVSWFIRAKDTC